MRESAMITEVTGPAEVGAQEGVPKSTGNVLVFLMLLRFSETPHDMRTARC